MTELDPVSVKAQFPIFSNNPLTQGLSYLDNAATSHKPNVVMNAMDNAMRLFHSPIHRGFYPLAEKSTSDYENARGTLQRFINAKNKHSVVFTGSATDGINLIANGFLLPRLMPNQKVWVSRMEHHANYLPWQAVCEKAGAKLAIIELNDAGELDFERHPDIFTDQTAMIAVTQVSNVSGVTNDVKTMCENARLTGIPILVDAAQAVVSNSIDVQSMDCDFLVFSAHKMFGPNGIGLLYIAPEQLAQVNPSRLGGGMVDFVGDGTKDTVWSEPPHCFEAGSPNFVGAVGFAAACDFVESISQTQIKAHIGGLANTLYAHLADYPNLHIVTPKAHLSSGIVSFYHDIIHAHELAQIMGDAGVAVRAGHHCAQPFLQHLGVSSTLRVSISAYNNSQDIDAFIEALNAAEKIFA